MSPQAALVDRISEAQKLIRRFQEQQEKLKVPPPPLPQPARTEILGRLGLFRRRPFVFPAGRELREAPPPPDLRELLTERQPLAPISERETPSLAELLGQRQPISPVSARVTAPFQMPRAIPIGRLPGATGEPYRPAQERAIREKLGVAELPPAKAPIQEEIVKQYESYFAKLSPEVDLRGNPIPQWQRELSGIGMVGALGAVGAQGVVAGWRALTNLALVRQVSRRLTFGGEPPTQAQTQVIANDIRSMAQKAGRGWELDRKSLRTFFKPIGKGNIAPTEAGVREAEAVAQRAVTRYAPSLVPRGTQTGAMAFGGREVRLSPDLWNATPVAQRVAQATQAGLSGQVGSKAFEALTIAERTALGKVTAPVTPVVTKLTPDELRNITDIIDTGVFKASVSQSIQKDGQKLLDAVKKGDTKTIENLMAKYEKEVTKGISGGAGPKPAKPGRVGSSDIWNAAKKALDKMKPAIPKAEPVTPAPEVTIQFENVTPDVKTLHQTWLKELPANVKIDIERIRVNPEAFVGTLAEEPAFYSPMDKRLTFKNVESAKNKEIFLHEVSHNVARTLTDKQLADFSEEVKRLPPRQFVEVPTLPAHFREVFEDIFPLYLTNNPKLAKDAPNVFAYFQRQFPKPVTPTAPAVAIPKAEPVAKAPAKEAVTAKPRARKVPPAKAPPPAEPPVIEPPEPVPPSDRPRTLLDLNREAKGMRAFSPKDRAAIMDVARPLKEDELLYKVKPFSEHADNLLQPDTPVRAALRAVPGVKQVAGAWTPAQMQRNNPVAMLGVRKAIFEEIEIGRARLATLNWWHDADELFNFKKIKGKWKVTNIELSASAEPSKPYHGTIHDLIEHPGNYVFTPEQEKVLQIAQDMQRQILRDAQRVGVDAVELTGDYWRRIVTKAPKDKMFGGKIQSRIASRKGYTRQRAFDFVDDGAKLGFEYETHPLTALQNRLEAGIRTISDQNTRQAMARLPGVVKPLERLESLYPQTVEGAKTARQARDAAKQVFLRDKTVENETALRQAEADYISSMRELFFKKIEAGQPNIGELKLPNGRIAPAELVEEVRHWIDLPEIVTGRGTITNPTLAVTQLLRSTLTNVDLAAGFIQGQALFYRNNIAWWRSQGNAIVGLIDDPTAYVAKNFDLMDEGMRMGAISIPTEFMFTRQGLASIPTRVPVVGPVMKSFNRAFEWFILTGQTELYRATRSGAIKRIAGEVTEQKSIEALVSLGSAIRKELGTESYAILGVRPTQRTLEQLALFAARFFRSLTGVQAQAFTGGEGGREARRAMGAAIVGGIALTIAASYLLSKKMPNMTDPFNPDWMQFEIGDTRFNAFGPFYPYFRTQARVSIYMLKGKPVEAANEIKRFFQGKAGIPFRAIDMAAQFGVKGSYRTFEGKTLPFTPVGIGEAVLGELAVPISVQEAMRALPQGRPEAVAGEVFGLVGREKYPWFPKETFDAYYEIPADPDEAKAQKKRTRTEYRKTHSTIEAKLFITGRIDTISSEAAISEVLKLVRENKINPDSIRSIQANKEKWTEIRAGKRAPPKSLSLTDKLVARLSQLGVSPVKETPTPVAPATKPKIVIPEGYVPSWAR